MTSLRKAPETSIERVRRAVSQGAVLLDSEFEPRQRVKTSVMEATMSGSFQGGIGPDAEVVEPGDPREPHVVQNAQQVRGVDRSRLPAAVSKSYFFWELTGDFDLVSEPIVFVSMSSIRNGRSKITGTVKLLYVCILLDHARAYVESWRPSPLRSPLPVTVLDALFAYV